MKIRDIEVMALGGVALIMIGAFMVHIGFGVLMAGLVILVSRAYIDAEGGDDWKKQVGMPAPATAPADPITQPWEPPVAPTDPLPEQWKESKGPTA